VLVLSSLLLLAEARQQKTKEQLFITSSYVYNHNVLFDAGEATALRRRRLAELVPVFEVDGLDVLNQPVLGVVDGSIIEGYGQFPQFAQEVIVSLLVVC